MSSIKQRGFSLFEILLVLIVFMVAIVAVVQYMTREKEKSGAEDLGYRLFQYGLAVTDYARQNPDGFTPADEPIHVDGYAWLQNTINPETCADPNDVSTCKPFLGAEFSLDFPSIVVGDLANGQQLYTVFNVIEGGTSGVPDRLGVELIELGIVYKYAKTQGQGNARQQYEVDLSLASRAANFASEYRDQRGSAVITYTLSGYEEDSHIIGVPSTGGPNVDYGYLLTSGQNEMNGPVRFSASTADDQRAVRNVGRVEFTEGAVKTFQGLKHSGSKGRSNNLPIMDFIATASRIGNNTKEIATPVSTGVAGTEGFCFSAGYNINPHTDTTGSGENTEYSCKVFREDNGIWAVEARIWSNNAHKGDALTCYATCVRFNW